MNTPETRKQTSFEVVSEQIPLYRALFWDIQLETLDWETHASFIIGRVVSRGRLEDWQQIKAHYGIARLKQEVVKLRHLDAKSLHFCSAYFDVPLSQFRCYNKTPFTQTLLNY